MAASRNSLSADLAQRVGAFVAARLSPDEHLCVGLSGGCDSVVLLHALTRLDLAGRLTAMHVHHGLSSNADDWADFCIEYCRRLGISLAVHRVKVEANSGKGIEAAARSARYAAFAEYKGDCLMLAQHRGDQAETVLLNLLRGAGVTGVAAMPAERYFGRLRLLRPLLDIPRQQIESYAFENNLAWITDESNSDIKLTRNFLRHEVLPVINQRFSGAESALAQAATNFSEASGLLDELAFIDWQQSAEGDAARLSVLRGLSLPRLKNLLRYRLRCLDWQVPVASRLDEFARQIQSAGLDRHPELVLMNGKMRATRGLLHWLPEK